MRGRWRIFVGFTKAGFELLASIENDPVAAETYAANLHKNAPPERKKTLAMPRDLLAITPGQAARALGGGAIEDAVDVILAGLPCQAFARIGRSKLRSLADDPAAYRTDPRAGLYRRFLKYVRRLKPLCIVLENVPDILNHGGHNVPEEISRRLERWGYVCRYTLLNAARYGVPQLRERLFLIAYHSEVGALHCFRLQRIALNFLRATLALAFSRSNMFITGNRITCLRQSRLAIFLRFPQKKRFGTSPRFSARNGL
jgi:DNA (cytosine-5)-methyltransferase 1